MSEERMTKEEMLPTLAAFRKVVLDKESTDLNTSEFRKTLAKFINAVEGYVIEKERW